MNLMPSKGKRSAQRSRLAADRRHTLAVEPLESRHLLSVTISDPSFETPSQNGGYTYNPTGTNWTFTGSSGIEANGSAWGAPNAPDGVQAAFLQSSGAGQGNNGQASQTLNFTSSGNYGLEFQAAQRSSNGSLIQSISLYLDGALVNTYTPANAFNWSTFGVVLNIATAGNHTIAFQAVNTQGDESCFLDNLSIGNYTSPIVSVAASATPNPISGTTTSLSVLGGSSFGESSLTYTWSTVGTPPAPVNFSANGTNAAKNATASFTQSGDYSLQVTIADPFGGSAISNVTVHADVGLGTPANLSAIWNGNFVNLVWSPAVGAQKYNVYRGSTSRGETVTPIATGLTVPNYVDGAVTPGQPYYYEVTAVSAAGVESGPSAEAQPQQISDGASYRYDLADGGGDTAANTHEFLLNPLNVATGNFSKQFTVNVDGQVLAEPLYVDGVSLTGGLHPGVHNVAIVATEHDSVYAIDANGGQVLWQFSPLGTFNVPNTGNTVTVSTVPSGDVGSGDISPEIGITGTPVVDTGTGYMYVVVKTKEVYSNDTADPHYVNTLYKIHITDGSVTATVIADTTHTAGGGYVYNSGPYVLGSGDGAINVGGQSRVYFNSLRQMFRPAVLLSGGQVVLGSASHGDNTPYHGWMLTYDENSLALTGVLNTSPNAGYSGIWQGDAPIVVDPQGYFYFETGNGYFNQNSSNFPNGDTSKLPIDGDYGDSIVKVALDPSTNQNNQNVNGWGLKIVDYFTPEDQNTLNGGDTDLGSGGPIILPDSAGSALHPHLLIGGGKEGKVYLIDRDHMGGFSPTDAGAVQTQGGAVGGILSALAYFNGTFYYTGGYNGGINAFSIANGAFSPNPTSSTPDGFGNLDGGPVVTADGTVNAIVWALDRGTGQLRAYDATNLGHELYTSAQAANNADAPGSIMKYTTPMVADGQVFVGTGNSLVVYGVPAPPTTVPSDPTGLTAVSPVGSEVQLTWNDTSNNEGEFDVERSTDGGPWIQVGTVGVNISTYNDTTVQALTEYAYRVRARNAIGPSNYTNVATVTTAGVQSIGTGDGLLGQYYSGNSFNFSGQTPVLTRVDPTINFDWDTGGPDPVVGQTNFTVRWTGEIQAQYTEPYTFSTVSDDGIRVILNGQTIIDDESYHSPTIDTSAPVNLVAGHSYSIEVDYFQGSGLAEATLNWSSPSTAQQAVPQSQLFSGSAPAAPTLLPPVAASGTQINLAWTETSNGVTGFEIDRKLGAGGTYAVLAVVPPGTTTFLDAGLSPNLTYYYQVRSLNFGANSPLSNEVSLTTPVPPPTPSGAHPTKITTNEIDFAWTNNATDATITRVLRNATGTGGNFIFIAGLPPSTLAYNDLGPGGNGLAPGTEYDYHVQVGNVAGYSDFTGFRVQTLTTAPALPTAVGADGQVTLYWTAPRGAVSFNIYRGTTPGGEAALPVDTGLTTSTFVDTGLTDGQTYFYQITAVDTGGESARSAETSATPLVPVGPPNPPANLTPTVGDTQALLAWSAAPGAISYNVYQSTVSGKESLLQAGVKATSFAQSGLTNGTTYYYRVSSVNALGEGLLSTEVSVTPQTLAPPTPINVTATAADGQVSLGWTAASDAQSYNIYRSTDQGDEVLYQQGVVGTSFVDHEVLDGTTYFYQISAANGVGESNLSLEVSATPLPPLPAAPTSLSASGINASQIRLQWQESSTQLTGFTIERSTDGVTFSPLTTLDAGVTSYVDSQNLLAGTTYTYQVFATNQSGGSAPSSAVSAAVLAQVSPPWSDADIGGPAVAGSAYFANNTLTVFGGGSDIWNSSDQFHYVYQPLSGDGSIVVRVASQGNTDPWAKAGPMIRNTLDANSAFASIFLTPGNGAAFQYRQSAGGAPGFTGVAGYTTPNWVELTRSGSTFTGYVSTDDINWTQVGSITVAMNAQVYVGLAVTSHNDATISKAAFNDIAINAAGQPPAAPTILTAQPQSGSSAQLTWSESDSSVYGFQVLRKDPGAAQFLPIATLPSNAPSLTDTGLTPGASYSYQVVALNTAGSSSPSISTLVTLPVAPLAPSLLQFNQITTSSAGLSWQLNSSNDTGVNVYRRDAGATSFVLVKTLPAGSLAYVDNTLQAGTLYQYRVTAFDAAGESSFTDAGVTTLPAAPAALTTSPAPGAVLLHWAAPAGALAYNIYRGLSPGGEGITPYASGIDVTNFSDNGGGDDRTYYYRITAVNFSGESSASQEVAGVAQTAPQMTGASMAPAYLAPGSPTVIDPTVAIVNPAQVGIITSATVSISSGFVFGEDQLALGIADPNVTAIYDSNNGVLTLTGDDTPANYQALLRNVTFQDTSSSPTFLARQITFQTTNAVGSGSASESLAVFTNSPIVSLAAATQSVNENGSTFTVTVNLSGPSAVATTVPFTLGGTAVSGVNYSGVTASPLVIPAGQTSGTITGTLIDDGKFEPTNTTLSVTLGAPTNATLGATTSDTVTIVESDPEPTIALAAATQSANENGGSFTVTVNLSAASGVATTVPFTLGGTAVGGVNFSGVTASPLVIPAGMTSGTITGTLIDDGKFEPTNTTLSVTLGTPTNATLGATTSDTVTIVQSDPEPTISLAAATQSVNENGGSFTVTVNLSAASGVATTVPFTLGGTAASGVNYSNVTASPLVIPAGMTSGTITGTLIDDGKFESTNTTLSVTLGMPTNATLGALTSDTVTIVQSDPEPTVTLAAATQSTGENGGTFTVTVNLSAASGLATTVPFSLGGTAVNGVNYFGASASPLVIPAGMTSGSITVTAIDDGKYSPTNATLIVTLGTPTNASLGAIASDTITIVQSDPEPTVALAAATQSVNENGGTFTVTVNLSAASDVATTVPFTLGGTAASGVNYSNVTASPLVIPAGMTSGTITGTLIDDGKFEPTINTLSVTLGTPTNATLGSTTSDTVTIVQSDPEPSVALAAATQSVNENGGTFTVTVNLSAASGVATTVPFTLGGTAANGVNYSNVTASPLMIPAGQTSGTITGTLIDDGKFEPTNTTLSVTLGAPTNATLGATTSDTVTIVESDPEPTIALAAATQSVNENGGTFTVTVNLSAASGVATTVPFTLGGTAASGMNYSGVTASPLVIPAGQTSGTITGTLLDDGKFEPTNSTLTVSLSAPTNATLGAVTSDTVTIVQSDPEPTVSLAAATQSVNENGGTFTVTVNLSAASGVATTVPFTLGGTAVSGLNYSNVTASPLVIPAGSTSGTITGTLIDDGKFEPTNTTLSVTLGMPTNATLGAITSDTATIVESDGLPTVALAAATQSTSENDGTFTVTVNLSAASGLATTVPFSLGGTAVNGVNYFGATASPLVIPAGMTSGSIIVTAIDDGKYSPTNATLIVTLGTPTNASLGAITSDTVTIVQSDPEPTVALAAATQSVNENGGSFTVTVNLSAASDVATTVPFTLGGTAVSGVNYSSVMASPLVIPAGQTSGSITGTLLDDGKFEPTNTTLSVTLGTPTNATLGAIISDTVTILQSDPEPTVALAAATQSVNENGGTFTVTVNLSAASSLATTVPFTLGGTAANGVNYSNVTVSPLVIPAGMTSGSITGTLLDDGKFEPTNTTLTITLGTPTNASLGAIASDTVTIVQSDPEPTVTLAAATQSANENGGSFAVTVNLSAAADVATTVPFTLGGTAASGVNYSNVTTSPLVIPAGQSSGTITGTLLDDGKFESTNTTLTVSLGTPTNATLGATSSDTVTILQSDPEPTVALAAATQSVNENGGSFTVTVNLSAASGVATTVPFTLGGTAASGVNYSNVTASPLVIPAGMTSGTITGTLIDDGHFDATNNTLTVTLGTPVNATLGATAAETITIVESDSPLSAAISPVTSPRSTPVDSMTITFSAPVSGFSLANLQLSLGGGPNLLSGAQTLTSGDNMTWTLGNLTSLTGANGNYVLSLSATGIQDAGDNTLAGDLASSFTVNATVPTVAITPVSPDPRNSAVDSMTITFSEPVSGFSLANLQLSLGGGPNLLSGAQTLTSADNTTWTLGNLAALTAGSGSYSLTLSPAGIEDMVGNALAAGAVSTFTLHTWQNTANPLDVNVDHEVTPLDALAVIDFLNLHGDSVLPPTFSGTGFLDVNGDDQVTPLDALAVIDYINLNGSTPAVVSAVAPAATDILSPAPLSPAPLSPEPLAVAASVSVMSVPTAPALSTDHPAAAPVDAAITWAVSTASAGTPSTGSTASIAAPGPARAALASSIAPATSSAALDQAAVDSYFADGGRRKSAATVEPAAADIVLGRLPA